MRKNRVADPTTWGDGLAVVTQRQLDACTSQSIRHSLPSIWFCRLDKDLETAELTVERH